MGKIRLGLVGGLVALALAAAPALADKGRSASVVSDAADQLACVGQTLTLLSAPASSVEKAVVCLINSYRALEGRAPVHAAPALRAAASDHAHRMIAEHFFSHVDPDGMTLAKRLKAHRYVTSHTRRWSAAENIAIAGGDLATARHIVGDWMGSPEHRSNVLRSGLRDIGVSVVPGAPQAIGDNPVTVVVDLGSRS